MGQSQDVERAVMPTSVRYEADPRLIEFTIQLPSSFPSSYQKMVQEVQTEHSKVPEHQLYLYLTHCIDCRFRKYNAIDEQAFHKEKSIYQFLRIDHSKFEEPLWTELTSMKNFRKLISKFIQQYELQTRLSTIYDSGQSLNQQSTVLQNGGSLCQIFKGQASQQLEEDLLKKLFYKYYANVLRSYACNSEHKEAIVRFHQEVGKLLCIMIATNYFKHEQMVEMVYCMVYLEKVGLRPENKLDYLRHKYYCFCLEKKLTVGVEPHKLAQTVNTARLYLDELYLSSMREAEDPEIREQPESLSAVRIFPVQRAKQRAGR